MKETKVYVDELPKCCCDCICYNDHAEQCKINPKLEMSEFNYNLAYEYECYSDRERHPNCPLKSLHDHDKELVAKVLEKIKMLAKDNFDFDMCNECGEFVHNDNVLTESDFNKVLNQIQKEFEDE